VCWCGRLGAELVHFQVLIQAADVDGDGRISLEDFRGMLKFNKDKDNDK